MKSHLLNRFPNKTYWSHWCFRWAINQFSRVLLMSCMSGHIKVDLKSKRSTDSLLVAGPGMFQIVEEDSKLEGAYILFDAVNHFWIRSGKASPTTIADRFL